MFFLPPISERKLKAVLNSIRSYSKIEVFVLCKSTAPSVKKYRKYYVKLLVGQNKQ